ncbi:unnamed protein product, partial [Mesorhabditis spiculigera]
MEKLRVVGHVVHLAQHFTVFTTQYYVCKLIVQQLAILAQIHASSECTSSQVYSLPRLYTSKHSMCLLFFLVMTV